MKKPHTGSCHCGTVAIEVPLDLDEGVRRCNCSYCHIIDYDKIFAYGDSMVVTSGQDVLGRYAAEPSNAATGA